MGQSSSSTRPRSSNTAATISPPPPPTVAQPDNPDDVTTTTDVDNNNDYTSNLPDECLAIIFHSLSSGDRKRSSAVCRRWLRVEGQSRHRLSLNAQSELADVIPRLFSRFDAITKLALKCDRRSVSIGDDALILISLKCRNLSSFKIRACRELTDDGMSIFAQNCKNLQKFSCGSSSFGRKESTRFVVRDGGIIPYRSPYKFGGFELHMQRKIDSPTIPTPLVPQTTAPPVSIKHANESISAAPPAPKSSAEKVNPFTNVSVQKAAKLAALEAAGSTGYVVVSSPTVGSFRRARTLKGKKQPPACKEGDMIKEGQTIGFLDQFYNGQCFGPLIIGSKNLISLKVFRCSGDWDKLLGVIADRIEGLVEVHLERLQVSDVGLTAISNCSNLEILHLVKTPECTNIGLVTIAEKCRLLRKVHIDGWKTNKISDEGLIGIANHCPNLQELVLIGVNPTRLSIEKLATNCQNLERLALCGSETVGDAEISCIARKCIALKKLCIKSCPVSDHGMEALACGCPNLVKVKVKKCKGVTIEGADWLRASRDFIAVNLDAIEPELPDNSSDVVEENGGGVNVPNRGNGNIASSSNRSGRFKMRLGSFSGRSLVACNFRRWSSFGGRSRDNLGTN